MVVNFNESHRQRNSVVIYSYEIEAGIPKGMPAFFVTLAGLQYNWWGSRRSGTSRMRVVRNLVHGCSN